MRDDPFSFAACCATAGTPLRADAVADAREDAFVLREALRGLLWLEQMAGDGQALPDMREQWRKAWSLARDALNEDGPAS